MLTSTFWSAQFSLNCYNDDLTDTLGTNLNVLRAKKLNRFFCTRKFKVGHEEEMMVFPFHKRKVKTISMNPPIFGEY